MNKVIGCAIVEISIVGKLILNHLHTQFRAHVAHQHRFLDKLVIQLAFPPLLWGIPVVVHP